MLDFESHEKKKKEIHKMYKKKKAINIQITIRAGGKKSRGKRNACQID